MTILRTLYRQDRRRWARARTLGDLGRLTADWVEGHVTYHPGYGRGPSRPDPETADIATEIAAANRAGYVTISSQPGLIEVDDDGQTWRQRAAVDGVAAPDVADRLTEAARAAGLIVVDHNGAGWRLDYTRAVNVTDVNGEECTEFGARMSRRVLSRHAFPRCGCRAVARARRARQVTIVDPEWGPSRRVWDVLDEFAARQATP